LIKLAFKQRLDNALKCSPADMPLKIQIRHAVGGVAIAVTDHGRGIPALKLIRIFERMYRSPSVERRIPGSGLGLSIARGVMRAHRGDLTVTSHPGETIFRMLLLLDPDGATNQAPTGASR
jgi:signal transduction histidine kinase